MESQAVASSAGMKARFAASATFLTGVYGIVVQQSGVCVINTPVPSSVPLLPWLPVLPQAVPAAQPG